jgi:putative transposase
MQVFGLLGHIIRGGRVVSRLLDAETSDIEAARRRDTVARWRQAIADGLTAEQAATAVGVPRATLYRWESRAELRSKRPKRTRAKTWTSALVEAVETLRLDHPMWGRGKIGPFLRREGFTASDATVGRIIAHLIARGVVERVLTLRRGGRTPTEYLTLTRQETLPSQNVLNPDTSWLNSISACIVPARRTGRYSYQLVRHCIGLLWAVRL